MASQRGRDLLLKIGDGGSPQAFHTLGAARMTAFDLLNEAVEDTAVGTTGAATYAAAGTQNLRMTLQGLFKDSAGEALLRQAALAPAVQDYQLVFPNGDSYAAAFLVEAYRREGSHDGFEGFAVTLLRSGAGSWTDSA